jgi:hypothetical protein
MRKKIFYISAFLIFVLLLSSCTPGLLTDEELILGVIDDFFSALSEQKWDLAKSYCVDGSNSHLFVDNVKERLDDHPFSECNSLTTNFSTDISKVEIFVNNAQAYGFLTLFIVCDDEKPFEDSADSIISLQKIDGNWKIVEIGLMA